MKLRLGNKDPDFYMDIDAVAIYICSIHTDTV